MLTVLSSACLESAEQQEGCNRALTVKYLLTVALQIPLVVPSPLSLQRDRWNIFLTELLQNRRFLCNILRLRVLSETCTAENARRVLPEPTVHPVVLVRLHSARSF